MTSTIPHQILCPSAPASSGAALLGLVNTDGKIAFLPDLMPIDAEFLALAEEGRPLGQRFRFTHKCVKSACGYWSNSKCNVLDNVREHIDFQEETTFPDCAIRPQCRWFLQEGVQACRICPLIKTDMSAMVAAY